MPGQAPGDAAELGHGPFPLRCTDLQAWIRNEDLQPDWLRVGTDIVGGNPVPTFNAAFTLAGEAMVPEPASVVLLSLADVVVVGAAGLRRRSAKP
jgi:hypothetical protein